MRKILSTIFSKNYVTNSPTGQLPKVVRLKETATNVTSSNLGSRRTVTNPGLRSISMSSSPGSIPASTTSTQSNISIGPLLSSVAAIPVPKFTQVSEIERNVPLRKERKLGSDYASLLEGMVDRILAKGHGLQERTTLISELHVKQVLSKNEEMKKVIFKVAAMALAQNEEIGGIGNLHPFIITAGEVFFGGNYNEMGLGESSESIQDILTPGLLILLLQTCFPRVTHEADPNKHLLLAKALVQTSAGYLLHRTVQETNHLMEDGPENCRHFERMHQGNKLATLTGDLLVVGLIKNVAATRNNQVLELVMNSLSEFSTTEIGKRKPFQISGDNSSILRAMMPEVLAESIVFSKGFQSCLLLSGYQSPELIAAAGELGRVVGLLWKTNFDWVKLTLSGKRVENVPELNDYLSELELESDAILKSGKFIPSHHPVTGMIRDLIQFWSEPKSNSGQ